MCLVETMMRGARDISAGMQFASNHHYIRGKYSRDGKKVVLSLSAKHARPATRPFTRDPCCQRLRIIVETPVRRV